MIAPTRMVDRYIVTLKYAATITRSACRTGSSTDAYVDLLRVDARANGAAQVTDSDCWLNGCATFSGVTGAMVL